jgi:hypothetical protein
MEKVCKIEKGYCNLKKRFEDVSTNDEKMKLKELIN